MDGPGCTEETIGDWTIRFVAQRVDALGREFVEPRDEVFRPSSTVHWVLDVAFSSSESSLRPAVYDPIPLPVAVMERLLERLRLRSRGA